MKQYYGCLIDKRNGYFLVPIEEHRISEYQQQYKELDIPIEGVVDLLYDLPEENNVHKAKLLVLYLSQTHNFRLAQETFKGEPFVMAIKIEMIGDKVNLDHLGAKRVFSDNLQHIGCEIKDLETHFQIRENNKSNQVTPETV